LGTIDQGWSCTSAGLAVHRDDQRDLENRTQEGGAGWPLARHLWRRNIDIRCGTPASLMRSRKPAASETCPALWIVDQAVTNQTRLDSIDSPAKHLVDGWDIL
jgi:hypothetical protein